MKKRHRTRQVRHFKKTELWEDTDLLLHILILVEKYGSLCPEILICSETHDVFNEAYQRFGSWDKIVESVINFSNEHVLVEPKFRHSVDVVLELLRLENAAFSMREKDALEKIPDLHRSVVFLFGSWTDGLSVAGITEVKNGVRNEIKQ